AHFELLLSLGKKFEYAASHHLDARSDSCCVEITSCFVSILANAIGVEHKSAVALCSRPRDCGIADGGAHLENRFCSDHERQLMQDAGDGWTDDGDISPGGFGLHLRENFIARRKHGIKIVFDRFGYDAGHLPVWLGSFWFCQFFHSLPALLVRLDGRDVRPP